MTSIKLLTELYRLSWTFEHDNDVYLWYCYNSHIIYLEFILTWQGVSISSSLVATLTRHWVLYTRRFGSSTVFRFLKITNQEIIKTPDVSFKRTYEEPKSARSYWARRSKLLTRRLQVPRSIAVKISKEIGKEICKEV